MKGRIQKTLGLISIQRIALWGICLFLLFTIIGCSNSTMKFNQDKWIRAKDDASWDVRKKMAQDLVNSKMLVGKSKQEVIKMLGTSEDYSDAESSKLYYTIELNYGSDIDPVKIEYLIVSLDSKEQVTSVYRKTALDK